MFPKLFFAINRPPLSRLHLHCNARSAVQVSRSFVPFAILFLAACNGNPAPTMRAFGVNTEPWIFVMDKSGTIVYRVEGLVTQQEIERHLK